MKECSQDEIIQIIEGEHTGIIYLYTPLCGTCQTASKMLNIVEELLDELDFAQLNLNYAPDLAKRLSIESVPCLLVMKSGQIVDKIYAFHSVPYLYEKLNKLLNTKKVR